MAPLDPITIAGRSGAYAACQLGDIEAGPVSGVTSAPPGHGVAGARAS